MGKQGDRDNHPNQLNPNNDAYWQSRGEDERPDDWEERQGDDVRGPGGKAADRRKYGVPTVRAAMLRATGRNGFSSPLSPTGDGPVHRPSSAACAGHAGPTILHGMTHVPREAAAPDRA